MAKDFKIKGLIVKKVKKWSPLYVRYQCAGWVDLDNDEKFYHVYSKSKEFPYIDMIGTKEFIETTLKKQGENYD